MTKIQNPKPTCFEHWVLKFEIYLEFDAWNLEFNWLFLTIGGSTKSIQVFILHKRHNPNTFRRLRISPAPLYTTHPRSTKTSPPWQPPGAFRFGPWELKL